MGCGMRTVFPCGVIAALQPSALGFSPQPNTPRQRHNVNEVR
jgi:hypothetical protein